MNQITIKMKNILLKIIVVVIAISFPLISIAQITCLPCDQLGMSVNVGSDTTSLSIYHSGQYLTHPQPYNVFSWHFTDKFGNTIFQDIIVNNAFCNFSHSVPIHDTMNVIVYFTNDSAFLANGNPINCYFEDQIYWETGVYPSGTPWGRWEFIHGNVGVDLNNPSEINEGTQTKFTVYPNPTNGLINISLDKGQILNFELYNSVGKLVKKKEVNLASHTLNLLDFPSGIYLLNVFNQQNEVFHTRISKE